MATALAISASSGLSRPGRADSGRSPGLRRCGKEVVRSNPRLTDMMSGFCWTIDLKAAARLGPALTPMNVTSGAIASMLAASAVPVLVVFDGRGARRQDPGHAVLLGQVVRWTLAITLHS